MPSTFAEYSSPYFYSIFSSEPAALFVFLTCPSIPPSLPPSFLPSFFVLKIAPALEANLGFGFS